MMPRVSVVVATRNRRELLARALASVDAQRYRDIEIVIVDDGSTDGTVEWLRSRRPHDRIVENTRQLGAAASRNRGIAIARGEIIAFLDDDDTWRPAYLETQVRQLDKGGDVEMATTGHIEVDASGIVAHPDVRPSFAYANDRVRMLAECPVHTMSVAVCRGSAFARIGTLDETLEIVHDLDWYLRLLAAGGRVAHDPTVLVERGVPGGLVTRYRHWFLEESAVHERLFAEGFVAPIEQRRVRAARALLFARIAFERGDVGFGVTRLAAALAASPSATARIGVERLRRRAHSAAATRRNAGAEAGQ